MSVKTGKPLPPFGIEEIKRCIPHRDPMLMLTKVVAVGEGWIEIEHHVDPKASFFEGHFPGNPIMPGVLIIETVAQAGAMLIDLTCEIDPKTQFMAFTSVDKAKFRRPVKPNDIVCVRLEIARSRGPLYKFSGAASVDGQAVAAVDFSASIMNF
ncbi:MAG: 3-hydroxyacyl-ACP dehydratase FabZ [Robiginitomaculum sp.]